MKLNWTQSTVFVAGLVAGLAGLAKGDVAEPAPARPIPRVELAICLDTSGSMSGLLDAARQNLWTIVNDLATMRPTPDLRIALLTFGNDGHTPESGWVNVDVPFTTDLDLVSQHLFALTTNGGTEYVGRVLDASSRLDWTPAADLKIAIVAGNEGADQDKEVRFEEVCPRLIAQGIVVNSVFCGPEQDGIAAHWDAVARLADGRFASIDQENGTIVIETPFDAPLQSLSAEINPTYLWYGEKGAMACSNQLAQDYNASTMNSAAAATRAATKSSGLYRNHSDLVDATSAGVVKIEEVKVEDLPEAMQKMTLEQRKAHIEEQASRRKALQAEVAELTAKRDQFVAKELKARSLDESSSFDRAVRSAIREQAIAAGLSMPEPVVLQIEAPSETETDCKIEPPAAPATGNAPVQSASQTLGTPPSPKSNGRLP